MKFSLAVLVLLCLAVLVMSKSTSKHSTKAVKKAPVEDKSKEEEKPKKENDEVNDRVEVMSKSTSKHSTKAVKKAPVEDKSKEEEKPKKENDEVNDRVEGGVGTGETRPTHDDEAEADAAANAKPVPTKPPTGAKPGEIEE